MSFTKTNFEQLPPSEISQQLRERVAQLNAVLDFKLRALKKAPEGNLRISQCRGDVQYYHRKSPDDDRGHYLDAAHYKLAQSLAQKDYNQRLVKSLKKELKILQDALRQLEKITARNDSSETIINRLHPLRHALITTATLTDEQYAAAWQKQKYKRKSFQPDKPELYTASGIRVRSKSEIIIADTLTRLGIPYHYEYPLSLTCGGRSQTARSKITVHPDFLCLNIRTRQEFIWEHFGRMDDAEYSAKATQKLNTYNENGIYPGKNLIITVETALLPPDTNHIENLINTFLK